MKIEIKPATLKRLAGTDIDITDVAINEFLDMLMKKTGKNIMKLKPTDDTGRSKVRKLLVDDENVKLPRWGWNHTVNHLVKIAGEKNGEFTDIKSMFKPVNMQKEPPENKNGWKYVEEARVYVQNKDTNGSILAIEKARKELKISVRVEFTLQNGEMRYI